MPIPILMPALSPTMTDGNLIQWFKNEGDMIAPGEVIAEIETDKATMEVEAVDEGKLGKILVPGGSEGVAVNATIALLLTDDEEISALDSYTDTNTAKVTNTVNDSPPQTLPGTSETSSSLSTSSEDQNQSTVPSSERQQGRIFASPLARRLAKTENIDLASLLGTGPNGRIIKADVLQAIEKGTTADRSKISPISAVTSPETVSTPVAVATSAIDARTLADKLGMPYKTVPHTMMRKTIARRLTESKQTVPHFYLSIDCNIDKLLSVRKELNASQETSKISVNDFIIRAVSLSLQKVPLANVAWHENAALHFVHADIAVAVAVPDGLITPIIKKAETKCLATISSEMQDLIQRARKNALKPEEYIGGTFSLSNLGMYGVRDFSAVINPPQGCILAVGAGEQRPVVVDGSISVATVMCCTLSVDHRVVDGAIGAEFLKAFKKLIENPLSILL